MNLLSMPLKDMPIDKSLEKMAAVMKEVKRSHKNLYIIMKWKMAKLLIKSTDSMDLTTQRNLGIAVDYLEKATLYLNESKEAGGE